MHSQDHFFRSLQERWGIPSGGRASGQSARPCNGTGSAESTPALLADAYLPEVLERAREVLRRPISPAEVSALNMIGARHAEPGDADLLVRILGRTDSDTVRQAAIWMAYGLFDETETETVDARLVEAVSGVIFDPSSGSGSTKETAIRILADGLGAGADDVLLKIWPIAGRSALRRVSGARTPSTWS